MRKNDDGVSFAQLSDEVDNALSRAKGIAFFVWMYATRPTEFEFDEQLEGAMAAINDLLHDAHKATKAIEEIRQRQVEQEARSATPGAK